MKEKIFFYPQLLIFLPEKKIKFGYRSLSLHFITDKKKETYGFIFLRPELEKLDLKKNLFF